MNAVGEDGPDHDQLLKMRPLRQHTSGENHQATLLHSQGAINALRAGNFNCEQAHNVGSGANHDSPGTRNQAESK